MSLPSDARTTVTAGSGGFGGVKKAVESDGCGGGGGSERAVGFVGLGAMGAGMAAALVKQGFAVKGFDVYPPACEKLKAAGGAAAASAADAAEGAPVVVLMIATSQQAEAALFGNQGALDALPRAAVVVLCSTVPPDFACSLGRKLAAQGEAWELVDAPVSGGVACAADGGTLTVRRSLV
ncbi:hypothetical protein CLOP_g1550 [Closterium sp. NIES-67]|nr:hypothetical protein CLOP_g1550 [Closterium sp. NIES-67]